MRGPIGWRDPNSMFRGVLVSAELRRNDPMCRKGLHKMTPENTKVKTRNGRKSRECIACAKIAYDARKIGPREEPWRL